MTKRFALATMAAALLTTTALAQSAPPATSPAPAMKPAQSTAPAPAAKPMDQAVVQTDAVGKWRTSKLIGLDVYNAANEKIGDINELVTDSNGKIDTVVIGVGGFLGLGEHDVGIQFSQIKFVMEPVRTSSTTATTTGSRTATTTTTSANATKDVPDHAMINMTKDQLKALPAFKYASDTSASTTTTTTRPAPAATTPARTPAAPAPAAPAPAR